MIFLKNSWCTVSWWTKHIKDIFASESLTRGVSWWARQKATNTKAVKWSARLIFFYPFMAKNSKVALSPLSLCALKVVSMPAGWKSQQSEWGSKLIKDAEKVSKGIHKWLDQRRTHVNCKHWVEKVLEKQKIMRGCLSFRDSWRKVTVPLRQTMKSG